MNGTMGSASTWCSNGALDVAYTCAPKGAHRSQLRQALCVVSAQQFACFDHPEPEELQFKLSPVCVCARPLTCLPAVLPCVQRLV